MSTHSKEIRFKFLPSPDDIDLIVFDLGGVLLNIDYALTQQAFAELGIADVKALYSKAAQNGLFDQVEIGAISPAEFRQALRAYLPTDVSDQEIDAAWNALIQSMPASRLESVNQLRADHKTCILSNTNEIHIPCFEALIERDGLMFEYRNAFDQIFYSSRIGMRKPDKKAFEHVLGRMDTAPRRALFFDDSIQHIESAKDLGINSYYLEVDKEDISDVIHRFLNGLA